MRVPVVGLRTNSQRLWEILPVAPRRRARSIRPNQETEFADLSRPGIRSMLSRFLFWR